MPVDTSNWSKKKFAESREMWRTTAYNYHAMLQAVKARAARLERELADRP